jgi:hypothetical protein
MEQAFLEHVYDDQAISSSKAYKEVIKAVN